MAISDPRLVTCSPKYDATNDKLTTLCIWRNYAGLVYVKIQLTNASDVELANNIGCVGPTPKGEFFNYNKLEKTGITTAPTSVKVKTYKCSSDTAQNCTVSPVTCTTPTLVDNWTYTPTTYSATAPTAPQTLSARVGDTFSVISWTYPTTGFPFIYQIKYYPTGDTTKTVTRYVLWSNTVVALTGLTNDVQYTVEVRAISSSGVVGTVSTVTVIPVACPVCTPCVQWFDKERCIGSICVSNKFLLAGAGVGAALLYMKMK